MSEPVGFPPPAPPHLPQGNVPAGTAPSPTYAPPPGYAPPPQGYGPWTAQPAAAAVAGGDRRSAGTGLGLVAFLLALVAVIGTPIAAAVSGFRIGVGAGIDTMSASDVNWSVLTPVREWVLLGEIAFWTGTALGVWAIVQGIIAIAKNRGRGWGVAAVVIAVIGPFGFGFAAWMFAFAGLASAAVAGG